MKNLLKNIRWEYYKVRARILLWQTQVRINRINKYISKESGK